MHSASLSHQLITIGCEPGTIFGEVGVIIVRTRLFNSLSRLIMIEMRRVRLAWGLLVVAFTLLVTLRGLDSSRGKCDSDRLLLDILCRNERGKTTNSGRG